MNILKVRQRLPNSADRTIYVKDPKKQVHWLMIAKYSQWSKQNSGEYTGTKATWMEV